MLTRAQITNYDLIIVGDGSGQGWNTGCGWASILVDSMRRRRHFCGAMNAGSVNVAEALPYVQALNWYDNVVGRASLRQLGSLRAHIITDSQFIALCGSRAADMATELPRKHLPYWAAIREYRRVGYVFQFHWSPRMSSELNWAADVIAGLANHAVNDPAVQTQPDAARRAADAIDSLRFLDPAGTPISLYDLNPDPGP